MAAENSNLSPNTPSNAPLYLAGERVDGRLVIARQYREHLNDLAAQLGNFVAHSERMVLQRAAVLALLCERDELKFLNGVDFDEEGYRRNGAALKAALVGLGMAKKSRDITKREARAFDAHAAAVLDVDDD
jgi:hypothetical protein